MRSIYINELPFDATEEDVRPLFEPYGVVHTVIIGTNRDLGEMNAFALVDMEETAAEVAIRELDGITIRGHAVRISDLPGSRRSHHSPLPRHPAGGA